MDRRQFLRNVATLLAAITAARVHGKEPAASQTRAADSSTTSATTAGDLPTTTTTTSQEETNRRISATAKGKLPTRMLGKTGVEVAVLGFGAGFFHEDEPGEKQAVDLLHEAINRGINYIDTASSYGSGKAEMHIGKVMRTRREEVFLATKVIKRSYREAQKEFTRSLGRLKCDRVDLLQLHAVNTRRELEAVLAPDGALRVLTEAREKGLTRYIGITGHARPEVIAEALERERFDSVLIPLGVADQFLNDFSAGVLTKARELGIAIVGMKLLGMGRYVRGLGDSHGLGESRCLRYSLNLPISVGIVGMTSRRQLEANLKAISDLNPLSEEELAELRRQARAYATTRVLWWKRT